MADVLDQDAITTALAALPGWTGDRNGLVKRVQVPADSQGTFDAAVQDVGDEMHHHAVVETAGDEVTLRLWTHSAGGVTDRDVVLAGRLDQLLSGARRWEDEGSR